MLERPDIADETIAACLHADYGLRVVDLRFLPLGADANTAVFRAQTGAGETSFVKLRGGDFDKASVRLPRYLHDLGITHIIPPLPAQSGELWADLDTYRLILFPFVEGRDAYEVQLSDRHWVEIGTVLRRIHGAAYPADLLCLIQPETYTGRWRESVSDSLVRVDVEVVPDPVADETARFVRARRGEILDLVMRAERLAVVLRAQPSESVVCHSDLHAGNFHIAPDGSLYIVDWDAPILAPKERDLMYAGAGLAGGGRTPQAEEALFYQGYGAVQVDTAALAYYRCERIVQDIAIYCEELLFSAEGGEDRAQSLRHLMSIFEPGGTIELAMAAG